MKTYLFWSVYCLNSWQRLSDGAMVKHKAGLVGSHIKEETAQKHATRCNRDFPAKYEVRYEPY